MDRSIFVQCHATVKVTGGAQEVETTGLAIVALVGLVDVSLGQNEDLGAKRVPLDLRTLRLKESLLACRDAGK